MKTYEWTGMLRMDLLNNQIDKCRLDCDWPLYIECYVRKHLDMGLYIFDLNMPGLACNQNWPHIPDDNSEDYRRILLHKHKQRVH